MHIDLPGVQIGYIGIYEFCSTGLEEIRGKQMESLHTFDGREFRI